MQFYQSARVRRVGFAELACSIKPQDRIQMLISSRNIVKMFKTKWLLLSAMILLASVNPESRKAHRIPPDAPMQPKSSEVPEGNPVVMQPGKYSAHFARKGKINLL